MSLLPVAEWPLSWEGHSLHWHPSPASSSSHCSCNDWLVLRCWCWNDCLVPWRWDWDRDFSCYAFCPSLALQRSVLSLQLYQHPLWTPLTLAEQLFKGCRGKRWTPLSDSAWIFCYSGETSSLLFHIHLFSLPPPTASSYGVGVLNAGCLVQLTSAPWLETRCC